MMESRPSGVNIMSTQAEIRSNSTLQYLLITMFGALLSIFGTVDVWIDRSSNVPFGGRWPWLMRGLEHKPPLLGVVQTRFSCWMTLQPQDHSSFWTWTSGALRQRLLSPFEWRASGPNSWWTVRWQHCWPKSMAMSPQVLTVSTALIHASAEITHTWQIDMLLTLNQWWFRQIPMKDFPMQISSKRLRLGAKLVKKQWDLTLMYCVRQNIQT